MRSIPFWLIVLLVLSAGALAQDAASDLDIDLTPPEQGSFDPASVADIDVSAVPILPELTEHARRIYERGQTGDRDPRRFSKVGDCMTASVEYFMGPFGTGDYDLGDYDAALSSVVTHFNVPARDEGFAMSAFDNPGLATASGFNAASVMDALWADPSWCQANESPLACEYRLTRPAFSLIMFGTNDVMFFEDGLFDYYLRLIVLETIERDIVPVLYTIPDRPEFPEKVQRFNRVIVGIAQDYDLPLVNLWAAIQDLPNAGVDPLEPIHLSIPEASAGVFNEATLAYGYTVRNLITLQTFDILLAELGILDDATPNEDATSNEDSAS